MHSDLRRHHRFRTVTQSFVNLHHQASDVHILGQILDIGQGGLAFSYLPEIYGALPPGQPLEVFSLDLFTSGEPIALEGLPSRLVYDHGLPSFSPITVVSTRKCGLAFSTLSPGQENRLLQFIRRSFQVLA